MIQSLLVQQQHIGILEHFLSDAASNITCHDVPAWNMNNVYVKILLVIQDYPQLIYEDYKNLVHIF